MNAHFWDRMWNFNSQFIYSSIPQGKEMHWNVTSASKTGYKNKCWSVRLWHKWKSNIHFIFHVYMDKQISSKWKPGISAGLFANLSLIWKLFLILIVSAALVNSCHCHHSQKLKELWLGKQWKVFPLSFVYIKKKIDDPV